MTFAGDFTQMPPVFGAPLYSGSVGTQLISCMTVQGQQAAIGKALWHQVTTVVILRENMRLGGVGHCYAWHVRVPLLCWKFSFFELFSNSRN